VSIASHKVAFWPGIELADSQFVSALLDLQGADHFEPSELWVLLRDGRASVSAATYRDGRCFATLSTPSESRSPRKVHDVDTLASLLAGQQMKVVAADLGISLASLSERCIRTLRSMTSSDRVGRSPIIVVMAALAARGLPLPPAHIEVWGRDFCVVSTEIPSAPVTTPLSPCELEVWRLILEGRACAEVALERRTSPRTAVNQLSSIFKKLGVSGRVALRARAVEEQSREWMLPTSRAIRRHSWTERHHHTQRGRGSIDTTLVNWSDTQC